MMLTRRFESFRFFVVFCVPARAGIPDATSASRSSIGARFRSAMNASTYGLWSDPSLTPEEDSA